ncbi:MAG: metallophosphoesterase, partial [Polyangiaceae bacterium]|nr:metallophosphoesterase [Polyangiaceae bacterium]
VLLVADTHLGLDAPERPRVERRRRGEDFFRGFEQALAPALRGAVDVVVHGGDLFHHPRVSNALVERASAPLRRIADAGIPVVLVPGNHERGALPHALWLQHRRIHVFDRPRSFALDVRGARVVVAGFPSSAARLARARRGVRGEFGALLDATGHADHAADLRLLCLHEAFEGARVGPSDFTFRAGDDVVAAASLPAGFAAVLAGHIHRHQILTHDLRGRPLAAPVLYPGSVERTSVAERDETKGHLELELVPGARPGEALGRAVFRPLPTRPMVVVRLEAPAEPAHVERALERVVAGAPPDAVVCVRVAGPRPPGRALPLAAARLRALVPAGMSLDLGYAGSAARVRV